jgi:quinol monooxygenase YgiN
MNTGKRLIVGMSVVASALCGTAAAQEMQGQYLQIAEIVIDPLQLEHYKAAVREQIETAIRVEPGVLVLYSVSEKDNPTHIRVFEIYASAEAYRGHLETPHFKKYKTVTEQMVKSLKLYARREGEMSTTRGTLDQPRQARRCMSAVRKFMQFGRLVQNAPFYFSDVSFSRADRVERR